MCHDCGRRSAMNANRSRSEMIKYSLRMRGTSFAELARLHTIHPSVFSAVSSGRRRSHTAAKIIADALDSTPSALWPEFYGGKDD
ncbi:transcriptional regulator [Paracoccus sp. PS1]|uniref:helix-turn-helix domain-containing protein n=1 Tax=Paracoccus sp. PS1 TaxID=2963938 RepID=UPI00391D9C4F